MLEGSGMPYAAVNDIQGTMTHEHGKKESSEQVSAECFFGPDFSWY